LNTARAAKEKHMLFAFADKPSQDLFTANGLSGSLWDSRTSGDGRVNDFLGINEANFGINKANYYVKRQVDQRVVLSETGDLSEQVSVTFTNTSKTEQFPGGTYKNYFRFLVPENTALVKLLIDGQEQKVSPAVEDYKQYESNGFVPPAGVEVSKGDEQGKTLYGFLLTVAPNEKKTVTLVYVLPQKFTMTNLLQHYSLFYLKQPGTDVYPYTFSLSFPASIKAVVVPPGFFNQGNQIVYSGNVSTDMIQDMVLSKNN
jgi:hypothetical protein